MWSVGFDFQCRCLHSCTSLAAIKEISELLNTGLDDETLRLCVQLLEAGVNPEALATVVQELRREAAALKVGHQTQPVPSPPPSSQGTTAFSLHPLK